VVIREVYVSVVHVGFYVKVRGNSCVPFTVTIQSFRMAHDISDSGMATRQKPTVLFVPAKSEPSVLEVALKLKCSAWGC